MFSEEIATFVLQRRIEKDPNSITGDFFFLIEPFVINFTESFQNNLYDIIHNFFTSNMMRNNVGELAYKEMQLIKMFEVFCRLYTQESLLEIVTRSVEEFTLVHEAVKNGWFRLVNEVMVDRLHFDVNFYRVNNKLTLLHVAAKHCLRYWDEH
jgi:hypothetical protein